MSEVSLLQIAGGNSVLNKRSITLNGAGTSMQNPMLRGLGMDINVVLQPNVAFYQATFGDTTPPDAFNILTFAQIAADQYRHRAAIGYGTLGSSRSYIDAVQQFLRLELTAYTSQVVGTERQCWVKQDPMIEFAFTSAQGVWCAEISEAFYTDDAGNYGLTSDPGSAPATGMSPDPQNPYGWIEGGPDRILEFGFWDTEQLWPVDLPLRLVEPWKDEFDQKHYGGAKYVSIFEEGGAEDHEGTYIKNEYQTDITTLSNMRIKVADNDHEYRVVFRFRSELNDVYYVDKLVRFRVLTMDMINRQYTNTLYETDMPDIVYDEASGDFFWDGMTASQPVQGWINPEVIVDDTSHTLPLNDVTPFPAAFSDLRSVLYGGEIPIRFQRTVLPSITIEDDWETYRVERPNGASALPINVEKALLRRHIHSTNATFVPDTQFRFIEPTAPGDVWLEVINNSITYKQVVVWTEKGSLSLTMPLRNGKQYNVTSLLNQDAAGSVEEGCVNILMQTENTTRIVQVEPTTPRSRIRARYPGIGTLTDNVTPVLTPAYPDVDVDWPALTDEGEDYIIIGADAAQVGNASAIVVWGRKQAWRVTAHAPGNNYNLVNILGNVAYSTNARFWINYRIKITSGADSGTIIDNVMESPVYLGYTGTPDTGLHPGDVQLIYYERSIVIVSKPSDIYRIQIIGDITNRWYSGANLTEDNHYDISALVSGPPPATITLNYETLNPDLTTTSHGPFTIPRFQPIVTTPVTEKPVPAGTWSTGRLNNTQKTMPQARISFVNKTIEFYYDTNFIDWPRYSVTNPLDQERVIMEGAPPNGLVVDISRLFRSDSPFDLRPNQSLLVTLLQRDGPHLSGLYEITGEFETAKQMNNLRGLM